MYRITLGVALAMAAPLAGCKEHVQILNPHVTRNPIVFESPQGASVFEDALDDRYDRGDADIKQLRGRLSKPAFFNQQIDIADENRDGIISDIEAITYERKTEEDSEPEEASGPEEADAGNGNHTNGTR